MTITQHSSAPPPIPATCRPTPVTSYRCPSDVTGAAAGVPRVPDGAAEAAAAPAQARRAEALHEVPLLRPQPQQARVQLHQHQVQDPAQCLVSGGVEKYRLVTVDVWQE